MEEMKARIARVDIQLERQTAITVRILHFPDTGLYRNAWLMLKQRQAMCDIATDRVRKWGIVDMNQWEDAQSRHRIGARTNDNPSLLLDIAPPS